MKYAIRVAVLWLGVLWTATFRGPFAERVNGAAPTKWPTRTVVVGPICTLSVEVSEICCSVAPSASRMYPRGECILEGMVLEDVTASRLRPQQTAPNPTRIGVASSPPPHRLPLRETVPPLRRTTSRVRGNLHRAPREQSSAVRVRAGGPGLFGGPSIQMSVTPNWSETWPEGRELEKITPLRTGRQTQAKSMSKPTGGFAPSVGSNPGTFVGHFGFRARSAGFLDGVRSRGPRPSDPNFMPATLSSDSLQYSVLWSIEMK